MWRIPRTPGSLISLSKHEHYKIKEQIGEGGFSLVYSVEREDKGAPVVVKEFFPAKGAFRDAQGDVRALPGYESLFNIRKKNFESEAYHSGESSELSYQILPTLRYGNGFAILQQRSKDMRSLAALEAEWKKNPPSAQAVLAENVDPNYRDQAKIGYALTVVDSLLSALIPMHSQSRLHLDLSPQNILWAGQDQKSGRNCTVFLSDFGSAVKLTEKVGSSALLPSYSPGFAAPEMFSRDAVLTPATDLYSAGMILFFLCCGKDAVRLISRVPFKKDILKREMEKLDVSEPLRRHLEELISRSIGFQRERPQNAQEMQNAVRGIMKHVNRAPTLVSNCMPVCPHTKHFVGREAELNELQDFFSTRTDYSPQIAVVESTIRGLGKTEFALRYAEIHQKDYDAVEFCLFDEAKGLSSVFEQCRLESGSNDCELILNAFQNKDKKKLLIIDNYDTPTSPLKRILLFQNTDIIITARYAITEFSNAKTIKLMPDKEEAFLLFKTVYEEDGMRFPSSQETLVRRILDSIGSHTLLTDFVAQRVRKTPQKIEAVAELVITNNKRLWGARVVSRKDVQESEPDQYKSIDQFIHELFSTLFDEGTFNFYEKKVLNLMLVLLWGGSVTEYFPSEFICAALGDNLIDRCEIEAALENLISHNYLQKNVFTSQHEPKSGVGYVSVHPVVQMILVDLFHLERTEMIEIAIHAICNSYSYNPNFLEYGANTGIARLFSVLENRENSSWDCVALPLYVDSLQKFIRSDQGLAYAYLFLVGCRESLCADCFERVYEYAEEHGKPHQLCSEDAWEPIQSLKYGEKFVQSVLSSEWYLCLFASENDYILTCLEPPVEGKPSKGSFSIRFSAGYNPESINVRLQEGGLPTKKYRLCILGTNCSDDELNIPSHFYHFPVSEIADQAFSGNQSRKIIIPETVTHIGRNNAGLADEIIIKASIVLLEPETFYLGEVKTIQLPPTLKSIGESCFEGSALRSVNLPDNLEQIGKRAFACCGYLEKLSIPPTVKELAEDAFVECYSLKKIDIPASVVFGGGDSFPGIVFPTYETIFPE